MTRSASPCRRQLLQLLLRAAALPAPSLPTLTLITQMTEGYSAGQLKEAIARAAPLVRGSAADGAIGQRQPPPQAVVGGGAGGLPIELALLRVLPQIVPPRREELRELAEWTVTAHSPLAALPPEEDEKSGKKKR